MVSLAGIGASTSAFAQTPCAEQRTADAREDDGLRMRHDGNDEAALLLFRQSYDLCHGARALVRMASTEGSLGRWLDADAHLREGSASNDPWVVANRAHIESDQQTVARHVGFLELMGTGPSATVLVDGHPAGTWPTHTPIRVLAGTVTFTVQADGYAPVTRTVSVPPGATDREPVSLVAVPAVTPATQLPTTAPSLTPQPAAAVSPVVSATTTAPPTVQHVPANGLLIGLGVAGAVLATAGLIAGTVATLNRYDAQSTYTADQCATPPTMTVTLATCTSLMDQVNSANGVNSQTFQILGFAAGSVLAAASVALFWVGAGHDQAPRPLAFNCGAGPGTLGISCGLALP